MDNHKSGFINILGKPNAGKSTLLNSLLDQSLSITNKKAQTTRKRILGIWNDDHHQIIFSDTPGIIESPVYKMQEKMNKYIVQSFEDADVIIYLVDVNDKNPFIDFIVPFLQKADVPKILVVNKMDQLTSDKLPEHASGWQKIADWQETVFISALESLNTDLLLRIIKNLLPESPPYYPKDQLSDLNERFFVSEIIRKHILSLYSQEIPYSSEVYIDSFVESVKNGKDFAHIGATIFISRQSQKSILIGKKGEKIKQLGIDSRKEIEEFLGYPVYLELYVKLKENWRDNENTLKSFGY